jgi:hypothetical protein
MDVACAQSPGNLMTVAPPPKVTIARGQSATVKLKGKIAPGYHANSNKPHEDYLIPLRLSVDAKPLEVASIVYPPGHDEKYSFSEKPLNVLTGEFEISLTLRAPAGINPELYIVPAKLRYQACSDNACYAPKTIDINITADVR